VETGTTLLTFSLKIWDGTILQTAEFRNFKWNINPLNPFKYRVNFGGDVYKKHGLSEGPVLIDNVEITDWTHYPLEFTSAWVKRFQITVTQIKKIGIIIFFFQYYT